ncbi:MAG: FAD-binding protein [Armatimonadetes bacterium]|nr:FAD-binding protein [Armatimonadota bacterium]
MDRLASLRSDLAEIVGEDGVLTHSAGLLAYDCDALTVERALPAAVVLPKTTEQVAELVRFANQARMPYVPRGAGTGLSGGSLAPNGGLIIATTRMTQIIEIDARSRRIHAQAGAVNVDLSKAAKPHSLHYAPDPSSQGACTIGGNVGENSGGPHTLKYGVTVNHVTGVKMVLPDGEIVQIGGWEDEAIGLDLLGVIVGHEGTFGVVTEVFARLTPLPQSVRTFLAIFDTLEQATETVTQIIGAGLVPAALELMDRLALEAVEAAFKYGFPLDAEAALLIEVDGLEAGIERQASLVKGICERSGAREVRQAADELDRARLWAARKKAIGALGRLAPSCITQDGVIPRAKLPKALKAAAAIAQKHDLRLANVFHAGDGNLHPVLLFDDSDPDQVRRVLAAGDEILEMCLAEGGSLTGEHGIGVEKRNLMDRMFAKEDLEAMRVVKDAFNPDDRCNPDKMFPDSRFCYEAKRKPRKAAYGL